MTEGARRRLMVRPRVLILDENLIHQRMMTLMAKRVGLVAVSFSACDQAIIELKANPTYSAVFIDLDIPKNPGALNCLQSIISLRQENELRFPIIAITAYAMDSDKEQCFQAGADDYLSKPYTGHQFDELVHRWIDYRPIRHLRAS
jgi:CheY-like chemotaxis protein